ncbi:MAG TPA: type IV secretion system DNA-binding domain-containing protein, partial [Candidatus Gracilibacteria bacterium]|nr:type IV secretion system DNA-binding domain-containing protein [Candidatus Gracilibacteria bacterium]
MDLQTLLDQLSGLVPVLIGDIRNHPAEYAVLVVGTVIGIKVTIGILRYLYMVLFVSRKLVHLKITLPREESQKDKEKAEEKDFKEKIAIMEQFYRNVHELSELSLQNIIKTKLFRDDIITFELIAKEKVVHFFVVIQKRYQDLIEKQITSYYPNAEITLEKPLNVKPKGNHLKCYYAYQKNDFFYPIKTYKNLENDPLNDLTNIFSKLSDKDIAAIQICFRPQTNKKWQKKVEMAGSAMFSGKKPNQIKIPLLGAIGSIFQALIMGPKNMTDKPQESSGPYGGGGYVRMLQTREEVAKRIGEKAGQVYFDTVIRVIGSAESKSHATDITNNVALGLNLFKDSQMNWFQTRRVIPIDAINSPIMKFNYNNRLVDSRILGFGEKRSLLDSSELASMYHLPSSRFNYTPIINWLKYKIVPAPVDLPTEGILLGHNLYRGQKKEVRMMRGDRTRHHYIIGKSGSGKSVFLSWMARQDMVNGDGVCVVDPHGDLIEELIQFVPKERAKDVIIFNPSDMERPMGLNILEAHTPEEMDLASSQATEIFIKIFGDEIFGPRIQHYFRNGCLTLMEDKDEGATLIDVPRIFVDDEFMKYKVSKITNPVVKSFWEHEYAHTGERERQEMIPYFSAKFGPFITNSIMRNTI